VATDKVTPIRYPILLPNEATRDRVWKRLHKAGLGATCSYPRVISDYAGIKAEVIEAHETGARQIAARILTLPVHRYLREKDIEATRDIIKSCL